MRLQLGLLASHMLIQLRACLVQPRRPLIVSFLSHYSCLIFRRLLRCNKGVTTMKAMPSLMLCTLCVCAAGWCSEPVLEQLGMEQPEFLSKLKSDLPDFLQTDGQPYLLPEFDVIEPDPEQGIEQPLVTTENKPARCMSLTEFAAQGKTDLRSYHQLLECDPQEQEQERTSIEKLMNFLAHLRYE